MSLDLPVTLARLEAWLSAHAPAIHAQLTPGVTETDLEALEAHIGLKLPEAYRILYRTHEYWGKAFGLDHVPLSHIYGEWGVWRDLEPDFQETEGHVSHPSGAIKTQYINLGWIPLLRDWGGNAVGLDFDPGPVGKVGQVITFGRDERQKFVLADSLDAFLREYLERLEAGRVTVQPLEGFDDETWSIALHDAQGEPVNEYGVLADLYPGFGATPARRSH